MANILIIDDDPVFSDVTKQRLERAGHHVSVHLGPFGATVLASKRELDLVILDVFMPALDGPSLLKLIRQSRADLRAKVIFCSSMDNEPLAELAREHAADGWIPKSAERGEFVDYVAKMLQGAETTAKPEAR